MTPVAFETVSTDSGYELAFLRPELTSELSQSIYSARTSRGQFLKIYLDYESRGLRIAPAATRSNVPSPDELRATFVALGFDYDPEYDFSNARAAAVARAASVVQEDSLVDVDLPSE